MVGTLFGATIFLFLLLVSVQFLIRLYATSVVTSVAFDAANAVADAPGDQQVEAMLAGATARDRLGAMGRQAVFVWQQVNAQQVVLEVRALSPGFAPLPISYRRIDRTVIVRTERFR